MLGNWRLVDRVFEGLAAILVIALLGTVALGIVTRALDDPIVWTDELARFLMVWLAMLGWIVSSRRRGHVRIRFFRDLLPPPLWRLVEGAIQAGMIVLGAIVTYFGFDLVARNYDLEATTMPISIAWMYVPLVPAGIVTTLQAIAELGEQLRRRRDMAPASESMVE
jgi:TRAP-type C4-dicarboxylate transport system permease small subunit